MKINSVIWKLYKKIHKHNFKVIDKSVITKCWNEIFIPVGEQYWRELILFKKHKI